MIDCQDCLDSAPEGELQDLGWSRNWRGWLCPECAEDCRLDLVTRIDPWWDEA